MLFPLILGALVISDPNRKCLYFEGVLFFLIKQNRHTFLF